MLDQNPSFTAVNDAFPHIGAKLRAFWGHAEFTPYMDSLLQDTRNGARKGFPFEVLMALSSLSDEHDEAYPRALPKGDMWQQQKPL